MTGDAPLWIPSKDQVEAAPITAFMRAAATKACASFATYPELHRWSIEDREGFWSLVWDFCGIVGDKGSERVLVDGDRMPGAAFFPDATLNFAENLLKKTGSGNAIVFRGEDKVERRLSWNELHPLTPRLQQLWRYIVAVALLPVLRQPQRQGGVGQQVS